MTQGRYIGLAVAVMLVLVGKALIAVFRYLLG